MRRDMRDGTMSFLTPRELLTEAGHRPFLDAFARKTRWYLPVDGRAAVETLLPWAQIESLIANSLVPADRFRVAVNGNELPASMFSDEKGRLRRDAIQGYAAQGASLVVNDIGTLVPAIGNFATALERDLRCRVHVNCYITFGERSAFIAHHDFHDVLILQIHGAKRWRSFGTTVPFPL